jgi:hypothetical protein
VNLGQMGEARAVGDLESWVRRGHTEILWLWIGSHDEYERLIA